MRRSRYFEIKSGLRRREKKSGYDILMRWLGISAKLLPLVLALLLYADYLLFTDGFGFSPAQFLKYYLFEINPFDSVSLLEFIAFYFIFVLQYFAILYLAVKWSKEIERRFNCKKVANRFFSNISLDTVAVITVLGIYGGVALGMAKSDEKIFFLFLTAVSILLLLIYYNYFHKDEKALLVNFSVGVIIVLLTWYAGINILYYLSNMFLVYIPFFGVMLLAFFMCHFWISCSGEEYFTFQLTFFVGIFAAGIIILFLQKMHGFPPVLSGSVLLLSVFNLLIGFLFFPVVYETLKTPNLKVKTDLLILVFVVSFMLFVFVSNLNSAAWKNLQKRDISINLVFNRLFLTPIANDENSTIVLTPEQVKMLDNDENRSFFGLEKIEGAPALVYSGNLHHGHYLPITKDETLYVAENENNTSIMYLIVQKRVSGFEERYELAAFKKRRVRD